MDLERRIIGIGGTDAVTFLQGLTSNDMRPLAEADGLVYTALLSPQGKYLADFFVGRQAGQMFLDMPDPLADATLRRLSMYRLRADVQFAPLDWTLSRGRGATPQGALPDPRHTALGWRFYGAQIAAEPVDWDAIRVAHLIPEYGSELIADDSYILEMGFETLHGVDFRKGCYVGQEVTARMKHKTELRKGLARVRISGAAEVGSEISAEGRVVGRLGTRSGDHALAWLRLDRANGVMQAGEAQLSLDVASD